MSQASKDRLVPARSVRIDRYIVSRLHQHAQRCYPHEALGLLLGRASDGPTGVRVIRQLVIVPSGPPRDDGALIDPKLLLHWDRLAARSGEAVVGVFVGRADHPAQPIDIDPQGSWPSFIYLIASTANGMVAETAAWVFEPSIDGFVEAPISVVDDEAEFVI